MNLPEAAAIPWLLAAQNPRFTVFSISFTERNSWAIISADPSEEPLSTTMISN